MRRVLLAVLVLLVVAHVGCRTKREDSKDSQRVEHQGGRDRPVRIAATSQVVLGGR
jgi:hypothetical protein